MPHSTFWCCPLSSAKPPTSALPRASQRDRAALRDFTKKRALRGSEPVGKPCNKEKGLLH